jgi:hypothetical protein
LEGQDGEERPRFNISRPGQLFHDDADLYVILNALRVVVVVLFLFFPFLSFSFFFLFFPIFPFFLFLFLFFYSFSSFLFLILRLSPQPVKPSTSNNNTTTATTTQPSGYTVSPYPTKYFQTENMALSLNQFLAQKKPSGHQHGTPISAVKPVAMSSPFGASIPNTPVSPESMLILLLLLVSCIVSFSFFIRDYFILLFLFYLLLYFLFST